MSFREDDRAVSIAVNHAITLGITAILVSGLLVGSAGELQDQQERVLVKGLQDVGESAVSELLRIDRIVQSGVSSDVSSEVPYPATIAGQNYQLNVRSTPEGGLLVMSPEGTSTQVPIRFRTETPICDRTVNGGPIEIRYDLDDNCLTIAPTSR